MQGVRVVPQSYAGSCLAVVDVDPLVDVNHIFALGMHLAVERSHVSSWTNWTVAMLDCNILHLADVSLIEHASLAC